jgi:PAS domain S-box-containing protein
LRRALDEALKRLQAVAEVSGGPLGTLEFELQEDGELAFVRADSVAGRLITVANRDYYGKRLTEVFTGLLATDLADALRETARHGTALPGCTFVPAGTRLGRAFSMFAFQPAPARVVIKFWESSGLEATQEIGRRNQEFLSQIFQNSPVAIALSREPEGRLADVNAAWSRLTGYQRHEVLGRTTLQPSVWRNKEERERTLGTLRDHGEVHNPEVSLLTRDGNEIVVSMLGSSVEIGGVRHHLLYLLDITARKHAEDALRQLNAVLETRVQQRTTELAGARDLAEQASRVKSEFLANMSHEIRTPLNAIVGLNYLMRREGVTPEQAARLDKIDSASKHLLSLINDILDLSKIEAGQVRLDTSNFHLSAVLDTVASIIAESARAKGLTIETDANAVPLWLRGDPARLRQALLNFAGNAIKFTECGSIALRAKLLEDCGDELLVRFSVEDTGIGIAAEAIPRLFQVFEQADASINRNFGGTGLGLAITKRLTRLMGGECGVDSKPGVGSTFWFTAPLLRGHGVLPAVNANSAADAEALLRRRHRGERILVAEDNPVNQEVLLAILHGVGLNAAVAANGQEAVALAKVGDYCMALMDMQMPLMGGLEATRAIRELPDWRARPILALTANAFDEDRLACKEAGMDDFIIKPVDVNALYATILHWLDGPGARASPLLDGLIDDSRPPNDVHS